MPNELKAANSFAEKWWFPLLIVWLGATAFSWSTQATQEPFDYTARTASALLHGHLGVQEQPPDWLNEFVPARGVYYSVFPLGAVLTVMPIAAAQDAGLLASFPGGTVAAILAGLCLYFFFQLSSLHASTHTRRLVLAVFPIFGTWFWSNVGFAGAWQLALAFALLGEVGALYFTLLRPNPFIAGAFFALASGNRTELILTWPIFIWLWLDRDGDVSSVAAVKGRMRMAARPLVAFCIVPLFLGIATAFYNYARFGSVFDFGYSRIPGVTDEPWYSHGIFSVQAIPYNVYTMLFEGLQMSEEFPYFQPDGFGCSILLASPLLCLLFRRGGRHARVAWIAVAVLTFALWCHGNPGGWQFAYRYGIILLPWFFLLLLESGGPKLSVFEAALFFVSVAVNASATYLLMWTDRVQAQ